MIISIADQHEDFDEIHVITVGAADRAMISDEPGRYGGLAFSLDGGLLAFTRYEYDLADRA